MMQLPVGMTGSLFSHPGAVLCIAAGILSFAAGAALFDALDGWRRSRAHKASVSSSETSPNRQAASSGSGISGLDEKVVSLLRLVSLRSRSKGRFAEDPAAYSGKREVGLLRQAGLSGSVSVKGLKDTQVLLTAACGAAGFLVGFAFSPALGIVCGCAGALLGWREVPHVLGRVASERVRQAERHLPEMLEVVALGMRSGLSFDSSLELYSRHFDTILSRELSNAQRQWTSGLERRDEALRKVASTYDSAIFGRVVETIVRSIRYGSSMSRSLEQDAAETRSAYRAVREERIAKAPVKMMVPTGTLILPAMLILVLGPVFLELMEGGI